MLVLSLLRITTRTDEAPPSRDDDELHVGYGVDAVSTMVLVVQPHLLAVWI